MGLLGEWAGKIGGRPLRLVVQVCGILLTACLTLFCAAPLTLLVMAWVGRQKGQRNYWPAAMLFSAVVALLFMVEIQPIIRHGSETRERRKRGFPIGVLIDSKQKEYDAELRATGNGYLNTSGGESPRASDFDLCWTEGCRTAEPPPMTLRVIITYWDAEAVIRVGSRGGTKEEDFLDALTEVIREHGWKMELTRERAAEDKAESKAALERRTP